MRPTVQEMTGTEKIVHYSFSKGSTTHHTRPHEEAPGLSRRLRKQEKTLGKSPRSPGEKMSKAR